VFLPAISFFSAALALLLLTLPAQGLPDPARPSPLVQVVAGSGEVTPAVVERVRGIAEEQLRTLVPLFEGLEVRRCFVFVHGDREHLPAELGSLLHEDSPGFTLVGRHQIHLVWGEMRRTGSDLRGVVTHELVHELLDQAVHPHGREMPRWFHEGLAQHIAGDTYLGAREEDLVWRIGTPGMFAFGELRREFPHDSSQLRVAYAQSYSYVAWLVNTCGLPTLLSIARAADDRTTFERALVGRTGRTTLELEDAWRHHLLHGSGAPARALLDQCFSLMVIGSLPVLVLALMRRLAAERRAGERLARSPSFEPEPAEAPPDDTQPEDTSRGTSPNAT
jgi:hypothetical protein